MFRKKIPLWQSVLLFFLLFPTSRTLQNSDRTLGNLVIFCVKKKRWIPSWQLVDQDVAVHFLPLQTFSIQPLPPHPNHFVELPSAHLWSPEDSDGLGLFQVQTSTMSIFLGKASIIRSQGFWQGMYFCMSLSSSSFNLTTRGCKRVTEWFQNHIPPSEFRKI